MENLWFWIVAAGLALGVAGLLILGLTRGRPAPEPAATRDLQVYRDQMAEVDRDLARGTLPEAEASRLRTEIGRRLLEADRAASAANPASAARSGLVPAALVLVAVAGALIIYNRTGVPWYPDMPLERRLAQADQAMATRPTQAEVVAMAPPPPPPLEIPADFAELMEKLRQAVDPATATDPRGLELLARNEAALGNFAVAEAAQRRLIVVKGDAASADDYAGLAEILIRWAGGYISPEAEAELIRALERDPANGVARYYSGEMFAQNGRFDRAFALWAPLYDTSPPDAPWMQVLPARLQEVARLAGENWAPRETKGPDAGDMAAAADMTPEEQQAMIEGMVATLSDRLATEGGSAQEWAQLITALGVLGRTDEARAILAEAQTRFAGRDADLAALAAAAAGAGIAP